MAKLSEISTSYLTTSELSARTGRPAEACPRCGCSILALLHTGELVCGECGPEGRVARSSEVFEWCIVVVEPDGAHVLRPLGDEQKAAELARDTIDLTPSGHGVWRREIGGWRRVG